MRLRLLTYNIHKGFCFYSRQYVLQELREAIRIVNADVVFLQEVMGVHPPAHQADLHLDSQFEFLADSIWSHFAYGKNAVYSEGHHGNAILSKFPILRHDNINVSTNPREKRGLLHAQIELPGHESLLHLVCLHLDLFERGRAQQMRRLIDRVRTEVPGSSALIVAGDFNDWRQRFSEPMRDELSLAECGVHKSGRHVPTFPSWRPFLALDRVYQRGFDVHDHRVMSDGTWRRMSDHAAIVVELELRS